MTIWITKKQLNNNNSQQKVCCYAGRRIYSHLHIAINPYPADGILSAFVVIFINSFSISSGSGLDIKKYQHSSKLWPLAIIIKDPAMRKIIILLYIPYLLACNGQTNTKPQTNNEQTSFNTNTGYLWTQLTDNAAFQKSYNFQMFNIRDTLWVLHHDGGWYSLNGKDWAKSALTNIIKNNGFLDYVWFKDALYGLGTFTGNIEHYTLTSAIHKTSDMKNWEVLADTSNLPKRFFYHPFVFDNKIWIIGGGTENEQFSDIWNSSDGIHWIKQAENLPFGKRQESQFVFFNGKIFMLNNDVWSSSDAIHWAKEADRFVKEDIFGYSSVVYDNKIWLLGCNRNNLFRSEALVSSDGKTWTSQSAPWSPRGGTTSCIFKNKVYMTGGKYGGTPDRPNFIYSNDVWTMEKQ
jgi:hypothetical protein